jgi:hypothetical protein
VLEFTPLIFSHRNLFPVLVRFRPMQEQMSNLCVPFELLSDVSHADRKGVPLDAPMELL